MWIMTGSGDLKLEHDVSCRHREPALVHSDRALANHRPDRHAARELLDEELCGLCEFRPRSCKSIISISRTAVRAAGTRCDNAADKSDEKARVGHAFKPHVAVAWVDDVRSKGAVPALAVNRSLPIHTAMLVSWVAVRTIREANRRVFPFAMDRRRILVPGGGMFAA